MTNTIRDVRAGPRGRETLCSVHLGARITLEVEEYRPAWTVPGAREYAMVELSADAARRLGQQLIAIADAAERRAA